MPSAGVISDAPRRSVQKTADEKKGRITEAEPDVGVGNVLGSGAKSISLRANCEPFPGAWSGAATRAD